MNRILFGEQEASYVLSAADPRFEHVRGVLRLQQGDNFDVGLINGPLGRATVTAVDRHQLAIDVDWENERPPLPPPVELLIGLCRPATVRKLLRAIPTVGVRRIVFFETEKSEKDYGRSRLWEKDGWRERLIEGLEQAYVDTYLPPVDLVSRLDEALGLCDPKAIRLSLDLFETEAALPEIELTGSCILAVGPERGWGGLDRKKQGESGFRRVSLGHPRVMRVETAVVYALGSLRPLQRLLT